METISIVKAELLDESSTEETNIILEIDPTDEEDPLKGSNYPFSSSCDINSGEKIVLDRLPRPVNELNCRMARAYLVKLIRIANNGNNPAYGAISSKPPFWPDHYWPWEQIQDIHAKPIGMKEPLQYSVMLRLAIARGYEYYGYNPHTYLDPTVDISEKRFTAIPNDNIVPVGEPPILPRPCSKLNAVQGRTSLAKLLRYQQLGNNPVYGSPNTQPPWWPEKHIRWIDMVDLRGKPKYMPDTRTFNDVIRLAVHRALTFYGKDPETYYDDEQPKQSVMSLAEKLLKRPIEPLLPKEAANLPDLPPKLPYPPQYLTCSELRTSLSKLLWFNNKGHSPEYGSISTRPKWWPNHLIEWESMKNLCDKYNGHLGNTYTNSLKAALISGYSHFGLDCNVYVEDTSRPEGAVDLPEYKESDSLLTEVNESNIRTVKIIGRNMLPQHTFKILKAPTIDTSKPKSKETEHTTEISHKVRNVSEPRPRNIPAKPMPGLVPLELVKRNSEGEMIKKLTDQEMLNKLNWFPQKVIPSEAFVNVDVASKLMACKVHLTRLPQSYCDVNEYKSKKLLKNPESDLNALTFFNRDRLNKNHVDLRLVSGDHESFWVHKFVISAHSQKLRSLLEESPDSHAIFFMDINSTDLQLLVEGLYSGEIFVSQNQWESFMKAFRIFQSYGLLRQMFRKVCHHQYKKIDIHLEMNAEVLVKEEEEEEEDILKVEPEVEIEVEQIEKMVNENPSGILKSPPQKRRFISETSTSCSSSPTKRPKRNPKKK